MRMENVIHGCCLEVLSGLDAKIASLVVADPPYGMILKESWDKCDVKEYTVFTERWLKECHRVLKDDGSLYVWASIGTRSVKYWLSLASLLSDIFVLKDMVVWSKQRGRGNIRGWLSTREEILWAVKDEKNYIWNKDAQYSTHKYDESWIKRLGKESNPYKRATNIWTDIDEVTIEQAKLTGGKGKRISLHPAQKPVTAINRLILAHTRKDDLVIDPFGGSGTTAISAKMLGRQFIIIEKDEEYVATTNARLMEALEGNTGDKV